MSDRTLVGLVRTTVVAGGLLALIGSAVLIATGHGRFLLDAYGAFALLSVFFAVVVWLVILQQPRNALVWTMAASAFFAGLAVAGVAGVLAVVGDDPNQAALIADLSDLVPADLSSSAAWILVFTGPAGLLAVFWLIFGLLLFPDGKFPSPRWRWVGVFAVAAVLVATLGAVWAFRPGSTASLDEQPLYTAGLLAAMVAAIMALVALVGGFRRSSGATRQQFKWVAWGGSISVTTIAVYVVLQGSRYEDQMSVLFALALVIFIGSYGIAVGRYRLFDIDLVIRRTVVYGVLVGLLAAVYIGAVVTLRALLPGGSDLAVAASTLAVAALFNPLRRRIQRTVDRRFYRSRYDAQQIVEAFASRVRNETDIDKLTAAMLQTVDQAVKPSSASVWIRATNQPQHTGTGRP